MSAAVYGYRTLLLLCHFSQGFPPCNPAPPFEKGVDPKTFLRTDNILFLEKERTWNAGTMDFQEPIYGHRVPPLPGRFSQGSRPATRRPLLKKGSIRKLFLRAGNILFMEGQRTRNAGAVDFLEPVYGYRAPSPLWCFVLSCMVGGIFRKPLGFRRCLPPARPEKAKPFQAGRSPCTKHRQTVRLGLHALKKVFEGSKGRFFKNAPLAGRGTASHKKERAFQKSADLLILN